MTIQPILRNEPRFQITILEDANGYFYWEVRLLHPDGAPRLYLTERGQYAHQDPVSATYGTHGDAKKAAEGACWVAVRNWRSQQLKKVEEYTYEVS